MNIMNLFKKPTYTERYTFEYHIFIGDNTLDKYKNKSVSFSGNIADVPIYLKHKVNEFIDNVGIKHDYVVVIDNWK